MDPLSLSSCLIDVHTCIFTCTLESCSLLFSEVQARGLKDDWHWLEGCSIVQLEPWPQWTTLAMNTKIYKWIYKDCTLSNTRWGRGPLSLHIHIDGKHGSFQRWRMCSPTATDPFLSLMCCCLPPFIILALDVHTISEIHTSKLNCPPHTIHEVMHCTSLDIHMTTINHCSLSLPNVRSNRWRNCIKLQGKSDHF